MISREKTWPASSSIAAQSGAIVELRSSTRSTGFVAFLPLLVLLSMIASLYEFLQPWALMWALAISLYFGLKWLTWRKARNSVGHAAWRSLAYLLAWPGMDAKSFLDETRCPALPRLWQWFWATLQTGCGVILLWCVARMAPPRDALLRGWIGMFGLILLLHFGIFQLVALCWQACGVDAPAIMSAPLRARSLSEFWGKRWNTGFRQFAHDLIFRPLQKYVPAWLASFSVFFVSGLIHDLVISVPARAGYGLPTMYFLLQGFGVMVERSRVGQLCRLRNGICGLPFAIVLTVAPIFWLFHPPFVRGVIVPFMEVIHAL
jgi:hypothetical protein